MRIPFISVQSSQIYAPLNNSLSSQDVRAYAISFFQSLINGLEKTWNYVVCIVKCECICAKTRQVSQIIISQPTEQTQSSPQILPAAQTLPVTNQKLSSSESEPVAQTQQNVITSQMQISDLQARPNEDFTPPASSADVQNTGNSSTQEPAQGNSQPLPPVTTPSSKNPLEVLFNQMDDLLKKPVSPAIETSSSGINSTSEEPKKEAGKNMAPEILNALHELEAFGQGNEEEEKTGDNPPPQVLSQPPFLHAEEENSLQDFMEQHTYNNARDSLKEKRKKFKVSIGRKDPFAKMLSAEAMGDKDVGKGETLRLETLRLDQARLNTIKFATSKFLADVSNQTNEAPIVQSAVEFASTEEAIGFIVENLEEVASLKGYFSLQGFLESKTKKQTVDVQINNIKTILKNEKAPTFFKLSAIMLAYYLKVKIKFQGELEIPDEGLKDLIAKRVYPDSMVEQRKLKITKDFLSSEIQSDVKRVVETLLLKCPEIKFGIYQAVIDNAPTLEEKLTAFLGLINLKPETGKNRLSQQDIDKEITSAFNKLKESLKGTVEAQDVIIDIMEVFDGDKTAFENEFSGRIIDAEKRKKLSEVLLKESNKSL